MQKLLTMKTIELTKKLYELAGLDVALIEADELNEEQAAAVTAALGNVVTVEAAKNSTALKEHFKKEMIGSLKGELLGNVDTALEQMTRDLFGDEKLVELKGIDFTKDRIKKVHDWYVDALKETKGVDEKLKGTVDNLKKQLETITKENEEKLKLKDEIIRTKEQEFTGKLLKGQILQMASKYELAEPYRDDLVRGAILETMWNKLNSEATIKFSEQGEIELKQKEDANLDVYKDNKKLGVKDLIEPFLSPYIKKAEPPSKGDNRQPNPAHPSNIPDDIPPALRHMREKAQKTI